MSEERDLRHLCFHTAEPDDMLRRNAGCWLQMGSYDSIMYWQQDGLDRIAQWSYSMGLHVFTVGMHHSCLRLVCPWSRAKEVVENIRKGNMEARLKKNEEIVAQLVQSAQRGFAVVVVGEHGSGKVWLCQMAIEKMGLKPMTVSLDMLEASDFEGLPFPGENGEVKRTPNMFKQLPAGTGVILDGLHRMRQEFWPMLAMSLLEYIRLPDGQKRVVFITIPPDSENCHASAIIKEWFRPATGESLGLEQPTVQVPK
jgi:hypothetical protein